VCIEHKHTNIEGREEEWERETYTLREETEELKLDKKNLEYTVYDLLKQGYVNNDKAMMIRDI
jgi:hypothetical protein